MKTCTKCLCEKPLDAFYAHPSMADGHLGKCKECTRIDAKHRRNNMKNYWLDYEIKRASRKSRFVERQERKKANARRATVAASRRKSSAETRARRRAWIALSNAIRDGLVFKTPCHICGESKVEGHHPDYSAPLDVVWLCTKHHAELHRQHRQQERKLFKDNKSI